MDRERPYPYGRGRREDSAAVVGDVGGLPLRQQLECFSEEVSSRDGEEERRDAGGATAVSGDGDGPSGAGAGAVCSGKRRRGRPPGSKNKPKPPPVVTRDVEPAAALRPHVLEVPAGGDVARALAGFASRRGLGISVLAATGAVADVALRHHPSEEGGAAVMVRGQYEILSISATFLPPSMSAAVPRAVGDLAISLAGPHGQVVGGAVAGPLIAATTVVVLAAAFTSLSFHRLPLEDDASMSVSGSGDADEHHGRQPEPPPDASRLPPHGGMAMASASQPATLYVRQQQEAWPPEASVQRPRPPYQ
ncbi:hypothetical protein ACP4OV_018087 [Aristida adscensionis]